MPSAEPINPFWVIIFGIILISAGLLAGDPDPVTAQCYDLAQDHLRSCREHGLHPCDALAREVEARCRQEAY